jgi:hypothetical protein
MSPTENGGSEVVTKCNRLKIEASDRTKRRGRIELFAEREEKTQIKKWLILWLNGGQENNFSHHRRIL